MMKKIAEHARSAKVEIKLASEYIQREVYDIQYVLSMLEEAKKQVDTIINFYCKEED